MAANHERVETGPAQMPVTPRSIPSARICASLVLLLAASPAWAQDGGVVFDAPRVLKLPSGHYDFNPAAFAKVDDELKRLQQLERVHRAEPSWATPLILGVVLGVVVAVPTTWFVVGAVKSDP